MQGLIEGRIVHGVLDGGKHIAALICEILNPETGDVYAHGFMPPSVLEALPAIDPKTRVPYLRLIYSEQKEPGTWHWIEK